MKKERVNLWKEGEYNYGLAFGFVPNMVPYLHEDEEVRPCMVVVPGGGYCMVSPTEGEIVAKKFYDFGYNCFVVTYTTNILFREPLNDQPMKDLSRAIRMIRCDSEKYRIDPDKLTIIGFSAGSHLCGSVCVHFDDIAENDSSLAAFSNRPDSAILSYPVITSGEYAHRDSFNALLGNDAADDKLLYNSLEKQVTENTPPAFLWHTATDDLVPVENSFLYASALKKAGVNYALHVFSAGHHGLSLGNKDWADHKFGDPYTMEQTFNTVNAVKNNEIEVPDDKKNELITMFSEANYYPDVTYPEIELWPNLADRWIKELYK